MFGFVAYAYNPYEICEIHLHTWWRNDMETLPALLARCDGNLPIIGRFSSERPTARSSGGLFGVSLDKQSEMPVIESSWGTCDVNVMKFLDIYTIECTRFISSIHTIKFNICSTKLSELYHKWKLWKCKICLFGFLQTSLVFFPSSQSVCNSINYFLVICHLLLKRWLCACSLICCGLVTPSAFYCQS